MAFSEETVLEAWKRSNGQCECENDPIPISCSFQYQSPEWQSVKVRKHTALIQAETGFWLKFSACYAVE
jgi:hypothetical protein